MISERRKPSQLSQAKPYRQNKPTPKKQAKSIRREPNLNCLKHISPIITARIQEQDIHKKKIQSLRNSPQRVKFQQKRSTLELVTKKSTNRSSMNKERLSMKASIQRGKVKSVLSAANPKKKKKKFKKIISKEQAFRWEENEIVNKRYQLRELIGKGAFGQVIRAVDLQENCFVAVKVIANRKKVSQQAQKQIQILKFLNRLDIFSKRRSVVLLKDHFKAKAHMCLVMQLLGINLFEVLHENGSKLPMIQVKQIAKSLIQCLSFIGKNRVIHADIKPQNILLQQCYNVRIVDFGSSCLQQKTLFNYIQSRFYRAPQIILGLPYDSKIDMWSAGCVIAQLAMGRPLFPAVNDADLLTRIIQIIGLPTQEMIQSSPRKNMFFSSLGELKLSPRKFVSLGSLIQDWSLVSFLSKIFIYEKDKRSSAEGLLEHEWICF